MTDYIMGSIWEEKQYERRVRKEGWKVMSRHVGEVGLRDTPKYTQKLETDTTCVGINLPERGSIYDKIRRKIYIWADSARNVQGGGGQ